MTILAKRARVRTVNDREAFVYAHPPRLHRDQNPQVLNGAVLESRLGSASTSIESGPQFSIAPERWNVIDPPRPKRSAS